MLDFIPADDREDGGGKSAVRHHDVRIHRAAQREIGIPGVEDRGADAMKIPLRRRCHIDAAPDLETGGIFNRDRRLAIVAIKNQRRPVLAVFFEPCPVTLAPHGDAAAQVERVPHQVLPRPDFHHAAAQSGDVIHRGLQCPVIAPDNSGVAVADRDRHRRLRVQVVLRVAASGLVGGRETGGQNKSDDPAGHGGDGRMVCHGRHDGRAAHSANRQLRASPEAARHPQTKASIHGIASPPRCGRGDPRRPAARQRCPPVQFAIWFLKICCDPFSRVLPPTGRQTIYRPAAHSPCGTLRAGKFVATRSQEQPRPPQGDIRIAGSRQPARNSYVTLRIKLKIS